VDLESSASTAPEGEPSTPATPRRGARRFALEIVQTIVLTLVIFVLIQNFVAQPFKVEGRSMEQSFVENDHVLVDRLTGRWSPYARGQVVVLHPPQDASDQRAPYIKRVIGVGGDTVEIRDGRVSVNGTALDEPYLFRNAAGVDEPTEASDQARWVVPDGDLFVLGDHRQASSDSRAFGPVPVSSVIGRAVLRYWPFASFGIIESPSYANIPAP